MRKLPLYERPPVSPVETCTPLERNPQCTLCELHKGARHRCIPDEVIDGDGSGTLLVVGESPGKEEDNNNRPFFGVSGALLRGVLRRVWKGDVVLSNALRCYPSGRQDAEKKFKPKEIVACRSYLAQTMREQQPTRVIVLGAWAALGVLGRKIPPLSARRGYGYLYGLEHEDPTPVFIVMHPAAALRNRFLRGWFEEDMEWALTCPPPPEPPVGSYVGVVETEEDALEAVKVIEQQPWTAFDIEARGVMHEPNYKVLALTAALPRAVNGVHAFIWTKFDNRASQLLKSDYLGDVARSKYGQSVAYDDQGCELGLRTRVRGIKGDVRLWRKLLDAHAVADLETMAELVGMGDLKGESDADIKAAVTPIKKALEAMNKLAKAEAGGKAYKPTPKTRSLIESFESFEAREPELAQLARRFPGASESKRWGFGVLAPTVLARRNAKDAVATALTKRALGKRLAADSDLAAFAGAFIDRVPTSAARIERWGVPTRRENIHVFDNYLKPQLEPLQAWADAEGFDPQSYKQVFTYLYKKLKLPVPKWTKKNNPSTDKEALEMLEERSPEVRRIVEYRHICHLRSTYGAGMIEHIRPDGRIHPHFLPDGAETGRWSCREPNLQNAPRPDDSHEGKLFRDCFVAEPGHCFVQLDFSQLELRVAALLSNDPFMLKIFADGVDYHMHVAKTISQVAWGIPPEEVQKWHRSIAKTFVFGALYGAGDEKLASTIRKDLASKGIKSNFTGKDAARVRAAIFGHMKVLTKWINESVEFTSETGTLRTQWNGRPARRRWLWQIADQDEGKRGHAERGAFNGRIQGSATDFLAASLVECVEWIEREKLEREVQLVLPVHDSLLFHCKRERASLVKTTAKKIMTSWPSGKVPLVVDVEEGQAWGSMVKEST